MASPAPAVFIPGAVRTILRRAALDNMVADITTPGRLGVAARRQAAIEIRALPQRPPYKLIACWMGGLHHTTVMNLLKPKPPRRNEWPERNQEVA